MRSVADFNERFQSAYEKMLSLPTHVKNSELLALSLETVNVAQVRVATVCLYLLAGLFICGKELRSRNNQ